MHKQHEDQPFISLTNLSTWHRVPAGATIPAGTPFACTYKGGVTVKMDGSPYDITVRDGAHTYYTEHPIAPPLPTEEGATIMASTGDCPPRTLLTHEAGRWVDCFSVRWPVDQITAWAPVTIGEVVVMP